MTLATIMAAFDEAALIALANKGIVRRAARDVEDGKIALAGREGDLAIVAADGETVRIDARGPAGASCTCPAPGVCRHRIAAVLLLQTQAQTEPDSPSAPAPSLVEEIAAIPEDLLIRFAGRAAWRAAVEIARAGAEIEAAQTALIIRLAGQDVEIRYLRGLGVENMVSRAPPSRRKALHAAALIAVRSHAGIEPGEVEAADGAQSSAAFDPAFAAEVRAALADACRNGLSLAPLALEDRLFTLSVSSRADALPRLGAMLRGIAHMVRERRTRGLRFDPDDCLGLIAMTDSLARALLAASDPARSAGLMGVVRQSYEEIGPLRLHGQGGEVWRAEGGARGATTYFYEPADDRWFTVSLARGAGQDPFFDPRLAFDIEAAWDAKTLAQLSRAELALDMAAASPQHRLSASAGSRPVIVGPSAASPDWPCSFGRWHPLGGRLRNRLVGTLAKPAPRAEPIILWPRRSGTPWFDDLTQRLYWPLEDADGDWIAVSLDYSPDRAAHFDHLASTVFRPGFDGAVIAAASIEGTRFALRPIALFDAKGLRSIDFIELLPAKRGFGDFVRAFARPGRGSFVMRSEPAGVTLLNDIVNELTGIAETGCRSVDAGRLARMAGRATDMGLPTIGAMLGQLRNAPTLAADILACRYAADQLRGQVTWLPMLTRGA